MCGHASLVSGSLLKPALSKEETERGRGGGGEREGDRERESEWKREGIRNRRGDREDNCRQVPRALQHTKKPGDEWSTGKRGD